MNTRRLSRLGVCVVGAAVWLSGCTLTDTAPLDRLVPHEVIAETIDFDASVDTIAEQYTAEGQDWLRMAFPDADHQAFALRSIGKAVPNVTYTPIKGRASALQEETGTRVLYFTQSGSGLTKDMTREIEAFRNEHKDISVLTVYPRDTAESLSLYKQAHQVSMDDRQTVIGENAKQLQEAFGVPDLPALVYVDQTNTIAYTAIGFQDLVHLNDHATRAFGDQPFYRHIAVDFDA